jgi:hypothetical protein
MSYSLQIYRAKPNPVGKEQISNGSPRPNQLLGEWVDIENTGTEPITFSKIGLHHTLFDEQCHTLGETERYWKAEGSGLLKPGQILRVHSGRHRDKNQMSKADNEGADWHAYAERDDFVLNNRCGDIVVVSWLDQEGQKFTDSASYAPHPAVDATLRRADHQLTTGEVKDVT